MKIRMNLEYNAYQPEIDGMTSIPSGYTIKIERDDGKGIKKLEALTVLQSALSGLGNGIEDDKGTIHGQSGGFS